MGTTATTNLALIKPDSNESIKEALPTFAGWADQNADNCDVIDALFRHTTHTGVWTPSWTTDIASNPVLGSGGFIQGRYIRLFPKMLIGYLLVYCGTTGFNPGSGLYQFSLPGTLAPELSGLHNYLPIGKAYLHDNDGVATSTIGQVMYELTSNLLTIKKHDGDSWRHNTPFTLAQSDRLSAYFMYPTTSV